MEWKTLSLFICSRRLTDGSCNKEEVEDAEIFCDGNIDINILNLTRRSSVRNTSEDHVINLLTCSVMQGRVSNQHQNLLVSDRNLA